MRGNASAFWDSAVGDAFDEQCCGLGALTMFWRAAEQYWETPSVMSLPMSLSFVFPRCHYQPDDCAEKAAKTSKQNRVGGGMCHRGLEG